jgi:hypothetical protein
MATGEMDIVIGGGVRARRGVWAVFGGGVWPVRGQRTGSFPAASALPLPSTDQGRRLRLDCRCTRNHYARIGGTRTGEVGRQKFRGSASAFFLKKPAKRAKGKKPGKRARGAGGRAGQASRRKCAASSGGVGLM